MREWDDILTGTAANPGREFYEFIFEYTGNYDRIDSGVPFGYTKPNTAYDLHHRDSWITEDQAGTMEHALIDLRNSNPFGYRIFWKRYFSSIPLRQFHKFPRLRKELRERYGWDGTVDELEWELRRAISFLYRRLELLINGSKTHRTN